MVTTTTEKMTKGLRKTNTKLTSHTSVCSHGFRFPSQEGSSLCVESKFWATEAGISKAMHSKAVPGMASGL